MNVTRRSFLAAAATLPVASFAAEGAGKGAEVKEATTAPEPLIAVKPHLQLLGEREMAVVWMTRVEADGFVEWTQDGGANWNRAWNEQDGLLVGAYDRIHKVVIKGYDPAKPMKYRAKSRAFKNFGAYKVEYSGEEGVVEGEINAIVPADGTISFAMINDVHNRTVIYPGLAQFMREGLSFTVFNGDIMDSTEDENCICRNLLNPLAYCAAQSKAPMWYLRGNHETRGKFARHLRDYIALPKDRYYGAVTLGPVRFAFLDTGEDKRDDHREYSGMVDFDSYLKTQTEWFADEIASAAWKDASCRIAFAHIPPDTRFSGGKIWKQPLERVRKLHSLLDNAKVSLVCGAHLHRPALMKPGELHPYAQVVGGSPIHPTLTRAEVKDGRVTVRQFAPGRKPTPEFWSLAVDPV